MSIKEIKILEVADIKIFLQRKAIKNIHLGVYPPEGKVKLSAPTESDDELIRLFVISKLSWLKKQIKSFQEQERETPREFVSGESHHFKGYRYLLEVVYSTDKPKVELAGTKKLMMYVPNNATAKEKHQLLQKWYREQLKEQIPTLIEKWEKVIGVQCEDWGVKRMRTKWGSCNRDAKRIWLNLELAKKPTNCLEYIIVHELVHLHERNHNDRFVKLMNKFMPKWRHHKDVLNSLPVRHEDWGY
jgi:predicted metal-dependent hydrolase